MFAVREVMKLNNGAPVLVCDLFQDSEITDPSNDWCYIVYKKYRRV